MSAVSTISSDFQVSIPQELRDKAGWQPGQKLALIPKGTGVLMIPEPSREELVGLTRGARVDDYRDRNDRY